MSYIFPSAPLLTFFPSRLVVLIATSNLPKDIRRSMSFPDYSCVVLIDFVLMQKGTVSREKFGHQAGPASVAFHTGEITIERS